MKLFFQVIYFFAFMQLTNAQVFWDKKYSALSQYTITQIIQTSDSGYFAISDFVGTKFNNEGDSIFQLTYKEILMEYAACEALPGNKIVAGGVRNDSHGAVCIVDENGTVLKTYDFNAYGVNDIMVDGSDIYVSLKITKGNYPSIFKLNTNLDTIWSAYPGIGINMLLMNDEGGISAIDSKGKFVKFTKDGKVLDSTGSFKNYNANGTGIQKNNSYFFEISPTENIILNSIGDSIDSYYYSSTGFKSFTYDSTGMAMCVSVNGDWNLSILNNKHDTIHTKIFKTGGADIQPVLFKDKEGNYLLGAAFEKFKIMHIIKYKPEIEVLPALSPQVKAHSFLYPNPAFDFVQVTTPEKALLVVTDATGKEFYKTYVYGPTTIEVAAFPKGCYIFSFHGLATVQRQRLVID